MVVTTPATKSICCGYEICLKVTLDIKLYCTQPMDVDIHILHVVPYLTFMQLWISALRLKMVIYRMVYHGTPAHYTARMEINTTSFVILLSLRFSVSQCFKYMRTTQKRGPLVNSEYYAGWLSHWREPSPVVSSNVIVRTMKDMLALNASINFYMFHGGTNFGFTAGANKYENTKRLEYLPQLTSYDYNAPLDEAGDPTEKYFKIKKLLEETVSFGYICRYNFFFNSNDFVLKNFAVPNEILPVPAPKGEYGTFIMQPLVSLFEKVSQRIKPIESDVPLGFEVMDINSGFVMYETILTNDQKNVTAPVNLTISTIRDQATIFLDQV